MLKAKKKTGGDICSVINYTNAHHKEHYKKNIFKFSSNEDR